MKFKFNLLALIALLIIVSCNNDDSPKSPAEAVQGNYEGISVAEHKYSDKPQTTKSEKIILTANTDGTSKIVFTSSVWGAFTVDAAEVSFKSDVYSLKGNGKVLMEMQGQSVKEYDCALTGTLNNNKTEVDLVFTVPSVMGGLTVTFSLVSATLADVVVGVHKGELSLSINGNAQNPVKDHKVTIKAQDKDKLEVTLAGFAGLKNMVLEDIVIRDVDVVVSAKDTYSLSGIINTQSDKFVIKGKLEGTINTKESNLQFTIQPELMPFPIITVFKGTRQK